MISVGNLLMRKQFFSPLSIWASKDNVKIIFLRLLLLLLII